MVDDTAAQNRRTIRRYLIAGVASCVLLVGGVGTLAATTKLSGAVIAAGTLVVDSNVKKVQHPTGGVVGRINVREGEAVKTGDVLISLDDTVTHANLAIVVKALDQFEARLGRLEAERDGKGAIVFPESLASRIDDQAVARTIAGEQSLFDFRRLSREGQKAQLNERIAQLAEEISGLSQQRDAKRREIELISVELKSVRTLWEKKYVSIERLTALERDAVRLEGEHGQLTASIAQAKGRSSEIELQIIQIDQDLRSEVATEIREVQGQISELVERKVAAEDSLKRIDVRSPQDGIVHQLTVHTIGGVVSPAEPITFIVPVSDELTIEARVAPQDIDQLKAGQDAVVRLSAFNQQTTPELIGSLDKISADLSVDERTGISFYTVRVNLSRDEVAKLKGLTLTAGMPAEVFFPTGDRSIFSYLVKPLSDQVTRAFRET
jgi:HlyD family secretion protein